IDVEKTHHHAGVEFFHLHQPYMSSWRSLLTAVACLQGTASARQTNGPVDDRDTQLVWKVKSAPLWLWRDGFSAHIWASSGANANGQVPISSVAASSKVRVSSSSTPSPWHSNRFMDKAFPCCALL